MPSAAKTRICVLGAGVIGMSSAVAISEALESSNLADQATVTIVAKEFSPATTSNVAAGLWEPYGCFMSHHVTANEERWAFTTLRWMEQVYKTRTDAAEMGIFPCTLSTLSESSDLATQHSQHVEGAKILSPEELELYGEPKLTFGFRFQSFIADTSQFIPWLAEQCRGKHGIPFRRRSVQSFQDLGADFDVVVNCSGLGAIDLVGDTAVRPVKGQIVRVHAPWIKQAMVVDLPAALAYIVPLTDYVVLGGTTEKGSWNNTVSAADTAAILERCSRYVPSLRRAKVLGALTGLRPVRQVLGARVDAETVSLTGHRAVEKCNGGGDCVDVQNGAGENGSAQNGSAQKGSAQNGSAQNGSAQNGSAQNGSAQNGSMQNGSTQNGSTQNGPAQNGAGGKDPSIIDAAALGSNRDDQQQQTAPLPKDLFVVHNYGHGGGGITMHYGCAQEAAGHVMQWLRKRQASA